jgi:predicted nucleic acid-binding Zn ribbon protein
MDRMTLRGAVAEIPGSSYRRRHVGEIVMTVHPHSDDPSSMANRNRRRLLQLFQMIGVMMMGW